MIITDWKPAVTEMNTQRCQAEIEYARAARDVLSKDRIGEIREFDLRIAECERWIMVLNRRATEALDAQSPDGITQREVDCLLAVLREHDEPEAHAVVARMWTAIQTMQVAQREQDLREAYTAGVERGDGKASIETRAALGCDDAHAAAEYARSKVGG
jgi:hypothetical protein